MRSLFRLPSPATVLALIALFVALGGTAVAAGIVPKAKFALNAGKLQGKTAAAVAKIPGPATSAAPLVTTRTGTFSLGAQAAGEATVACAAGEKAIAGGFATPQAVLGSDTHPSSDGASWQLFLLNASSSAASGTTYAVCLK
jgi:hypothetical protein